MGCIYGIRNEVNLKWYIGQCRVDAEKTRKRAHFNGHGSPLLKQEIEKYGAEKFTFHILHDGIIPELLNSFEVEYIAKYKSVAPSGYNLSDGTSQTTGMAGKKHSPETRRKMSAAQKGRTHSEETRRKLSKINKGRPPTFKGKKHTTETRKKISNILRNSEKHKAAMRKRGEKLRGTSPFKGKTHSEKTRCQLSEFNKGKTIPQEQRKKISESLKGRYRNPHRAEAEAFYFSLPSHLSSIEKWIRFRKKLSKIVNPSTLHRWFREWEQTEWKQTDTRTKQSVAAKNRPPISAETRRKLAKASTGRKYSVETRRKLSEANKGKEASAETRRKLSEAHKGRTPHNKSPDRIPAREFFLSLPSDMSLREKRRLLRKKFPEIHQSTIYLWVKEWTQDS